MCTSSDTQNGVSRRDLLALGAAGTAALAAAGLSHRPAAATQTRPQTPDESLEALKAGNARFVKKPELCVDDLAERRDAVSGGQAPWASIISCADSRVPPELLFGGLGKGELFVSRNAGNLVDTATLGTAEYGAVVLGAPLIVVLAHTACGAVQAACDVVTDNATYPGAIGPMIQPILPSAIAMNGSAGDYTNNTAKESARRTASRMTETSTLLADLVDTGKLKIVPAIYDLESGEVTFL
ncbi:carbonic anhydrase [Rhodovibrionaceae bacterium A322]